MDEYISASKYYKQDTRVQNGTRPRVNLSFRWLKKGNYQFLAKECAQYWLTA